LKTTNQQAEYQVSQYLKDVVELSRTIDDSVLVIDGASENFKSIVQSISIYFKKLVILTPLIDILHPNKIGVSRSKSVPNTWDSNSFRLLLLGNKYAVFNLKPRIVRASRILNNLSNEILNRNKYRNNVKILISLGGLLNIPQIRAIIQILKELQRLNYLNEVNLDIYLPDYKDGSLANLNSTNFHIKINSKTSFEISTMEKWNYVFTGGGLTFLEYFSLGFRCLVLPIHSVQNQFLSELNSNLFFKISDPENFSNYENLISWMNHKNNFFGYFKVFTLIYRNPSQAIWGKIGKC
jgi:hypothetical protein